MNNQLQVTWICNAPCRNTMSVTIFKDQKNIFQCKDCETWWEWEWTDTNFELKKGRKENEK